MNVVKGLMGTVAMTASLSLLADGANYDLVYDGAGGEVTVDKNLLATNVVFAADGYVLKGTGMLRTPVSRAGGGAVEERTMAVSVAESATAEIQVPVQNAYSGNFEKKGTGELILSEADASHLFRVAVYDGQLTLKDTTLETAKFQHYPVQRPNQVATLKFDNATVLPINNNTLIGEAGSAFKTVEIAEGGLKLGFNTSYDPVGELKINHPLTGAGAVTKLEEATYNLRIMSATSDFLGGWNLLKGKTYVDYANGLGTGPVSVRNDASFFANRDMTIANEIVLGASAKVGLADSAEKVTLERIGFTDDNAAKIVRLTAASSDTAEARTVVLGGADKTITAGGYALENGVTLAVDGATLKATDGAASPYVAATGGEATLAVGKDGLTFDTNGQDINLGATLVVAPVSQTLVRDPVAAVNGSFENGTDGWTFQNGAGSTSGVYNNDSGFVSAFGAWKTTNGTQFAVVRPSGGSLTKRFTLPEAGEWRIVFDLSNRPDDQWDNGQLAWQLEIDGAVVREMAPEAKKHSFARYESPVFTVNGDEEHVFTFSTGESQKVGDLAYDVFLIDNVRFEKVPVEETRYGVLTKTGVGALELDGLETRGNLAVEVGALVLSGGSLVGNTVNVKAGATLKFKDTLAVAIANASFEEGVDDVTYSNGFRSDVNALSGWTLDYERVTGLSASGWQKNGGIVSRNSDGSTFPGTTNGTHTAFLRPSSRMSQTVTIPADGMYTLTFDHSARGGSDSVSWGYLLEITVKMGDETICTVPAREKANYEFRTVSQAVELKAGTYTFAFETGDGGMVGDKVVKTASGPMVFIDGISLVKNDLERPAETDVVWNFEKGATLDIGSFDVELGTAFVDGVQVHGTKSAFTAAGLTVLGTGTLKSALSAPTIFIIR